MKLEKIVIENFKGLLKAELSPSSFGCLVGENNAGKSTILQAIVYALNRPAQLPEQFYYNVDRAIEFKVTFSDILPADMLRLGDEPRGKIEGLIENGLLTVVVRYRLGEKCAITVMRKTPKEERYRPEVISEILKGKTGAAVNKAVADNFPEFAGGAPPKLNITDAKEYLKNQIAMLAENEFEMREAPLPTGINNSINALLPEAIYVPAVKDLGDELKTTQSTSFGRLIGLLLDDMKPDLAAIDESLQILNRLLNRTVAEGEVRDQRHQKVKELENAVEQFLKENFPSAKVELDIPPPELKTILSAAQIFVDDGSRDLIENKGDGIKRSLTFALLQAYVNRLRDVESVEEEGTKSAPLIFLFEEPELYLHPKSQRVLFSTLARIAESHQVLVTTHSPLFFEPGVTASFVRVAKQEAKPKPIGVLYPVEFGLDQVNAEAFRLTRFENADAAFFSSRVVLLEGESDDSYLKHLARVLDPAWDFDKENIALVRVSGKGNFAKFRRFFSSFGLPVKIVADLDALFDGFEHLGAPEDVADLRRTILPAIDTCILEKKIPAEPSSSQIRDKVNKESWKKRYESAKAALRQIQKTNEVKPETLTLLDLLFVWEEDVARVKACREDAESRKLVIPLLDALRAHGICVLSKGSIEDYYPEGTPTAGPKPDRALKACERVENRQTATGLSEPFGPERRPELVEVITELFS
ncbi:MAG: AAA family ATPase [Parvibaculum sp.]|nr:AAA family ATPase [Parvibaculum sp.]